MNFEDIVDMDWVETHTTSDFSSEYFFDHQPDFLLEQPLTPPNMSATIEPEIKMEPIASMPTTEQIKQLIEIAKRQLALREQQQQHQPVLFQPIIDTSISNNNAAAINETAAAAAPSTLFSMPPIPVLSPTTVATSEITAIENATTLETISKQMNSITSPSTVAMTTSTSSTSTATTTTNNNNGGNGASGGGGRRDSLASMPDESISLEAYAEQDGIDLKRLTPKERRQLRNKLSARNFRVRRKEYISTLEGQVNDHKMAAEALKDKLVKVEEENKKLRKEMDTLKRQNQILQQQKTTSPRILSSPLPKPNLNKDISIMGTKATDSYRQQDNCILVSNAIMPAWDYQAILSRPKTNKMNLLVGQFLLSVVQLASTMPRRTNHIQDLVDYTLPLMPDDRDFSSSSTTIKSSISNNFASSSTPTTTPSSSYTSPSPSSPSSSFSNYSTPSPSSSYMEDLYDVLIQSALINSSTTDKSFWWWDNNNTSFTM
ncbi:hypothetical protein EDC94DRAFT_648375 [Helicostylum pulchrum]|nr:hypothetical protein EDC94DRAFT_648375 [Helicostylum pulchrum]